MGNTGAPTRSALADLIEEHAAKINDLLIERFKTEYPESSSSKLEDDVLQRWSDMEVARLISSLRGHAPSLPDMGVSVGDAQVRTDPLINPLVTFVEEYLFVSRTVALFIARELEGDPLEERAMLTELEGAVLSIIRASIGSFLDNVLVPGVMLRQWTTPAFDVAACRPVVPLPIGPRKEPSRLELTRRERQIVLLVAAGKTNAEISQELNMAQSTVKNHLARIFDKLNVNTRTELASVAMRRKTV